MPPPVPPIAYFSMEVALRSEIPTYAGGLGVLAGDTLRAAADAGLPMVGVTLVHREGYLRQRLDRLGRQRESPATWRPEEALEPTDARVEVEVEGRVVALRVWRYAVRGASGAEIPVYLLDADVDGNDPGDRAITDRLYGGDERDRLRQEVVLGIGGARALRALGHAPGTFHMNEGHSALLALALLDETADDGSSGEARVDAVRRRCVFTTHTPVPAGHDAFPEELARRVLGDDRLRRLEAVGGLDAGGLDMTRLALRFARTVNGVSLRHAGVVREMHPDREVLAITNGVHAATWASPPFRDLYDRRLPGWRERNAVLRHAIALPLAEVGAAHAEAKGRLLDDVARRTGERLDPAVPTIGFARRAVAYKRADLLFHDPDRLVRIARAAGPLQVVYAGKAHPRDEAGRAMIRRVHEAAADLPETVRVVWLEEYDMTLAARLCAGVDVWLNTPRRPLEASGTSGMKAALNGVPSLSVLDGWWVEGHVEGVTGWSIGEGWEEGSDDAADAASLYEALEREVLPRHRQPDVWARVMRWSIALNGSHFTAERMLDEYARAVYAGGGS